MSDDEEADTISSPSPNVVAFRAGNYKCPEPPMISAFWLEVDWIQWINDNGEWIDV